MASVDTYFAPRGAAAAPRRTVAGRVVTALGGVDATATLAGVSAKTVYRWVKAGYVPLGGQRKLVAAAGKAGGALDFIDFAPRAGEERL